MREIKFKVWIPYRKIMMRPKDIQTFREEIISGVTIGQMNQWVYLQYTGLQDKNGIDIYEGEIIFNDDRKENGIVEYVEEKAMFVVRYLESGDTFPAWGSISNLYYSVGNRYEHNHELIK